MANSFWNMELNERSMGGLFNSAVAAFPHTTRRQHATGPIDIDQIRATPFLGMNTLLFRYRATNTEENTVYNPTVLLRSINFKGIGASIKAHDDGKIYRFEPLSESRTDSRVRCQCGDFYWRFNYYDYLDDSLYGNLRAPYQSLGLRGPVNPTESPGICKHLMKFMEYLRNTGVFS